jgi:rare lipoprotein A (peptidoglycan hydrolase)
MQRICAILLLALAVAAGPFVAGNPVGVWAAGPPVQSRPVAAVATLQPPTRPGPARLPYQVGIASWYGIDFQGRETTSGTPFNMWAMTAAHRRLPLGTRIRVTDLQNRRSVVLLVNDRGPVPKSRVLDLSMGAAIALHCKAEGLVPVRIDVLPKRTAPPRP